MRRNPSNAWAKFWQPLDQMLDLLPGLGKERKLKDLSSDQLMMLLAALASKAQCPDLHQAILTLQLWNKYAQDLEDALNKSLTNTAHDEEDIPAQD